MHEMLSLRSEVFVVEQQSLYLDPDEFDKDSWHLFGRSDSGLLMAYSRISVPGSKYSQASLGRILVEKQSRGSGFGRQMIELSLAKCHYHYQGKGVRISAQTYLISFYQSFKFVVVGKPYDDGGVEHVEMVLSL